MADAKSMRLPDFILAGAMKCGTTSLRNILSHHQAVFIPDHEVFYFSLDDLQQHPHFFTWSQQRWHFHDVESRRDFYLSWYASFFSAAKPHQIVGENSTSYLASSCAPGRIAELLPDVKIIVMLRDPVSRAYSHYWHLVRTGRVCADFETCLRSTAQIVERSCYRHQVERLLHAIPRERVHFVLFEKFIREMDASVKGVCGFLGIDGNLDLAAINTRRNVGRYPRSVRFELLRNRLLGTAAGKVGPHLPDVGAPAVPLKGVRGVVSKLARRANPRTGVAPPMRPATREFLTGYFQRQNRGLSSLVGEDVDAHWWRRPG